MKGPYVSIGSAGSYPYSKSWYKTWYRTNNGQLVRTPLPYDNVYATRRGPTLSFYAQPTWGVMTMSSPAYNSRLEKLRQRAHNKAYAKWLDKLHNGIQLGVDLAEYRQTLNMVSDALKALRRPMDALHRACKDPLKAISGGYLAKHFGIDPLFKEVHDALELLEKGIKKRDFISAQRTERLEYLQTNTSTVWEMLKHECTVRHSAGVLVVDDDLFTLSSLGLTNPALIAWELVPYSFVVDWLYPVGTYLQSLDGLLGVNVDNPYTTSLFKTTYLLKKQYPAVPLSDPYNNRLQIIDGFCMMRRIGTPTPTLQKSLYPWSTSLTRCLTSLSLLVQAR